MINLLFLLYTRRGGEKHISDLKKKFRSRSFITNERKNWL